MTLNCTFYTLLFTARTPCCGQVLELRQKLEAEVVPILYSRMLGRVDSWFLDFQAKACDAAVHSLYIDVSTTQPGQSAYFRA